MKPILFNTNMVRAVLGGRKTVTRRVAFPGSDLRPFPRNDCPDGWWFRGRAYRNWDDAMRSPQGVLSLCKYKTGNILYVQETWAFDMGDPADECGTGYFAYKADGADSPTGRWRPSIHMPKEAARLFLRVTNVRVERLQDITEDEALKEGFTTHGGNFALDNFEVIWNSTVPRHPNKFKRYPYYWADNPWVWVIEFERISRETALEALKGGEK